MSADFDLRFRVSVDGVEDAASQFSALDDAVQGVATAAPSASGAMDNVASSAQSAGEAAKQSATKTQGFANSLQNVSLFIGTAISTGIGLARAIDGIGNAQDRATRAATKLQSANAAVAAAQKAYDDAVAKFGPNSEQATAAAGKLDLAMRRQTDAANAAKNANERVGFAWGSAATEAAGFGASMAGIIANLPQAKNSINGIKSALDTFGSSLTGGATGAAGLGAALATLALAAGAVFSAFKLAEGSFSAFDAIMAGLEGKTAKAKTAWDKMVASFSEMPTIGINAGQILNALDQLGIKAGSTAKQNEALLRSIPGIGNALADVAIQVTRFGTEVGTTWSGVVAKLKSGDIAGALGEVGRMISQSFAGAPEAIRQALSGIPGAITSFFSSLKWPALPAIPMPKLPDIATAIQTFFTTLKWPALPPLPTPKLPDFHSLITAAFAGFQWPPLPPLPNPKAPDIKGSVVSAITGFQWPPLPAIPMPKLPDIVGAFKNIFVGFLWPLLPLIPMPALPDIIKGLKDKLTGFQWPTLPSIPAPDTTIFVKALMQLERTVRETVESIKRMFASLTQAFNTSVIGQVAKGGIGAGGKPGGGGRHGLTQIVTQPSLFRVGEGFHPEMVSRVPMHAAARGFDGLVTKPTFFMAGEAGPELVNVIPLKGGSASGNDLAKLVELFEKFMAMQRGGRGGINANLFVDGQKMATVSEKYMGIKSYGDR